MPNDNDRIIQNILRREGHRFVIELRACSKFGITRETLADWRGQIVTCDDVKALSRDEAATIYAAWLERYAIDRIDDVALRELVFDSAVNAGPARAIRWLQRALGCEDDGLIGPKTLEALRLADARVIYADVLRRRLVHYGRIISADARQAVYAEGWMTRACEFIR